MSGTRGTSALSLAGGVLLVVVGATFLVRSLDELSAAVFGALLLVLGLVALAQGAVRAGAGRGSRATLRTDDGATVTSVRAPAATVLLPLVALAVVTAAALVWSGAAWGDSNPLLGVVLALLGLVVLTAVVPPLVRGARPDRVDLSPDAVSTEHFGRRVAVPWDDVDGCVPAHGPQPMALVLRDGVRPTVLARGWPLWRQPSAPSGVEPVVVHGLRVRPDLLARVVALCAEDPALRASLGTDASLDWLAFPPVHGQDEGRRRTT